MKRLFALSLFLVLTLSSLRAQTWKLVITRSDGSTEAFSTADIRDITFEDESDALPTLPDQYVDQIIIKEVYNGGILKDDGKNFQFDKCIILYNNCPRQAVVNNLCLGIAAPYNSQANNNWYSGGRLAYESDSYVPILDGIWWYPHSLVIEPFSQIVINVHGAIDNTLTYPNSVNYANASYYCLYDPESGYSNVSYYPAPSEAIPTSHYWKAYRIGQANAWALSVTSPALLLFQPQGVSPHDFAASSSNIVYTPGAAQNPANTNLRLPRAWVLDAVEVFAAGQEDKNLKRLTADLDAGYVLLTNQLGHTLYRNVDRELTEERPENAGRLVYSYALGNDPSGIDAEASMKNGAHIVFLKTNNSTTDFHERQRCSLRQ